VSQKKQLRLLKDKIDLLLLNIIYKLNIYKVVKYLQFFISRFIFFATIYKLSIDKICRNIVLDLV